MARELCADFEEILADPEALLLVRDGLEVIRIAAVLDRYAGMQGVREKAVHLANSKGVPERRQALGELAAACVVALATMPTH